MQALVLAAAAAALTFPASVELGWRDGAVYQVMTRPGRVTDIALEPGEALSAHAPVAAGDTARWIVADSESGAGAARQVHVLVKPVSPGLATNLLVATDRRTYHLELRSTEGAYMAAVAWRYPAGELIVLPGKGPSTAQDAKPADPKPAVSQGADISRLNFAYRLEGEAPFKPLRVFDDGQRTVIDFPAGLRGREIPPIFLLSADGKTAELVNFRLVGQRMILDQLVDRAELRLGPEKRQAVIRLVREKAQP